MEAFDSVVDGTLFEPFCPLPCGDTNLWPPVVHHVFWLVGDLTGAEVLPSVGQEAHHLIAVEGS